MIARKFDAASAASRIGRATSMLPWFGQELAETRRLMGRNFYPYGLEQNRKTLEMLFGYSYAQGLASRELTVEELFEPSSLTFKDNG